MDTNKTEGEVDTTNNEETKVETESDTVSISRKDYDTMNQTLGSFKRELKDLKKSREEAPKDTVKETKSDSNLLEKAFLRSAQITDKDEVELALSTAKKWGVEVDSLVDDEDFKVKLDKLRTNKSNILATSNVKGGGNSSQAKNTPEYWIAKGTPPSSADVPDRATRGKIIKALLDSSKNGKKFYND